MNMQNSEIKSPRTYQWVDIFKFFFCLCIIAMHSNIPFTFMYWVEKLLCRLGVPVFFVASGFFLSKSCTKNGPNVAVKRYCLRLLKLLAIFSIIWIFQFWIDCAISKTGLINTLVHTLQHILFFPNNALWYVQASIVGALLLFPFIKRKRIPDALLIGAVLYSFALLCNNYYFLIEDTAVRSVVDVYMKLFLAPHNGVFVGFLYLALGAFAERHLQNRSLGVLRLLLGASYLLYIGEVVFVKYHATQFDDGAFYVMQIAVAPLLLSVSVQYPARFDSERTIQMRHFSTGMYLVHLPLMWCYHRFCDYILPSIPVLKRGAGILWNGCVKFAVIVLASWAICYFAYRHTKTMKRFLM